jgi:hypothetical protein
MDSVDPAADRGEDREDPVSEEWDMDRAAVPASEEWGVGRAADPVSEEWDMDRISADTDRLRRADADA